MKKKNGFTLVELLVTIALILMVLGIAIVSIIKVSDAKKEEAYVLVKDQIMTAAEQYFYANEYLFEGLSEGSSGVITVGKLVEEDYLNKVTDPRTGKAINNCSQIQVTKTNDKFKSSFKEYNENLSCENNNLVIVSEPGAPGIDVKPSVELRDGEEWYNISNLNGKNLIMKVTTKTNGNGRIVGIKKCSGESDCTNFKDDYDTTDSSLDDSDTFSVDTEGKHACYQATNISNKSARICVFAKVDTEKPVCDLNVEGTAKNEGNTSKTNYTGWYTSDVNVLINNMSEDVATWSWKSDSWNSDEYDYSKTKPSDIESELYITSDGSNRSVSVVLKDKAGNENTIKRGNIKIDKTAPSCSVSISGERKNQKQDYWYTSNVTLSGKCSDSLSGCKKPTSSRIYNSEGRYDSGNNANTVYDNAGNSNNCAYSGKFGIDRTAPVITKSGGGRVHCKNAGGGDNAWGYSIAYYDELSGATARLTEYYSSISCNNFYWADSKLSQTNNSTSSKIYSIFAGCDNNPYPRARFRLIDGAGNESTIEVTASLTGITSSYNEACNENSWYDANR